VGKHIYFSYYTGTDLYFCNGSGAIQSAFKQNGNSGIGTHSPFCPLHVSGSSTVGWPAGSRVYLDNDQTDGIYYQSTAGAAANGVTTALLTGGSFVAIHAVMVGSGTYTPSDRRIKNNIVDADDVECLDVLRQIKPKNYTYRDTYKHGGEFVWGFIAQEVRDTLPYATQLRKEVIPNINEVGAVFSNVITFTNFITSNLEANACTIEVYSKQVEAKKVTISEVIDDHSIRVEEDLTEWMTETTTQTISVEEYEALENQDGFTALEDDTRYIKTTTSHPDDELFVYGQEVDDFMYLKKDDIFTAAVSALQEVGRQLQTERARNDTLEARILALETVIANL